jgi:hypothetical protein
VAGGASFPPTADEHTPREEELEAAVGDDIPKQLLNTSHAMTTSSKKSRKSQVRAGFREVHCQEPASAQGNSDDKASDCDAGQKSTTIACLLSGCRFEYGVGSVDKISHFHCDQSHQSHESRRGSLRRALMLVSNSPLV